ncbi:hypothetical protein SAMN05428961_11097 [Paenibacillus sp. OK060]|nr:hypothetical protein SAMN05428961_11097 [Paenibacillus sp. OK060]
MSNTIFQSTHSIRSATSWRSYVGLTLTISIHALHTECDWIESDERQFILKISIHALHTECDEV